MYENFITDIQSKDIEVIEVNFKGSIKGLYANNTIAISSKIETEREKLCILVEELGHHYTSYGDILDQNDIRNVKQEKRARNWGYERLVGILDLISAYNEGLRGRHEIADYLNVTEEFLEKALEHYKEKYGLCFQIDNYIVYFDPLGVLELF